MKKLVLAGLLSCFAFTSIQAELVWYEGFDYPDGPIIATSTNTDGTVTNWFRHSGSAAPSDAIVANKKLQVSATGGTPVTRQDDVGRRFCTADCTFTNGAQLMYASFTLNCTNLPNAAGTYFAHFHNPPTAYFGKVFAVAGTNSALPNTWRLGVSGAANSPSKVFPVDLALNTDYQVVIGYDPVNLWAATLWVNPVSSIDTAVTSNDSMTTVPAVQGFAFRQASSFGNWFCTVSNLAVATSFDEAATAVWSATPVAPVVAYQPQSGTNFVGNTVSLSVVAAGQGLGTLTYQWRKGGVNITNPDGNTNVLTFLSAQVVNSGNYDVVVTTPLGQSVTSAAASLWVTNPPVPPTITTHPTNTTVYFGQTAKLAVAATGSGTISYVWYYNGNLVSSLGNPNFSGDGTPELTIADVQTNNNTVGTYRCEVRNEYGGRTSSNAVLTATAAPAATIGYLRTLVDPVFFLPTNTTALYTVNGIVTTWTNVTSAAHAQFYLEDETGGIAVYVAGGAAIRPQAGDNVTVTGPLGQFNSLLELNLTTANTAHRVVINSSGNPLPPGKVLPLGFTNSPAFGGIGNAIQLYQGSVITFTNVWFPAGFVGTNLFAGGQNYTITNKAGETFAFRVDARVGDIIGQPIPSFAWRVTGPMGFFLGTTATNRSAGYQLMPTRYADIVTTPPAAASASASLTGGKPTLSWAAEPFTAYSILRATNVEGPYAAIISGLTFNSTAGQFVDTNAAPTTRFYQIVSP